MSGRYNIRAHCDLCVYMGGQVSLLDDFCVNGGDLWTALRKTRPTAMREVTIEVPRVLWSDIGGQEDIKQKFKESVEWPLKHPKVTE